MNIDQMTIGEFKELSKLFSGGVEQKSVSPMIGKYCIVRCRDAGVHAGVVESVDGRTVVLLQSRRLYDWWAAKEHTLSGVARHGLRKNSNKIAGELPLISLLEACEVIECSTVAEESIRTYEVYNEQE